MIYHGRNRQCPATFTVAGHLSIVGVLDATLEFGDDEEHYQCKRQDCQHDPNKWMRIFWWPNSVPTSFSEYGPNCKSVGEQPQPRRAFCDEDTRGCGHLTYNVRTSSLGNQHCGTSMLTVG